MKNHPLFTMNVDSEDQEAVAKYGQEIGFINVFKVVAGRPVTAGRQYAAHEIPSLDAFTTIFGGGDFELCGRGPLNDHVCCRVRFSIDAPEKTGGPPAAGSPAAAPSLNDLLLPLILEKLKTPEPVPVVRSPLADPSVIIAAIGTIGTFIQGQQAAARESSERMMQTMMAIANRPQSLPPSTGVEFIKGLDTAMSLVERFKGSGGEEDTGKFLEQLGAIFVNLKESLGAGAEIMTALQKPSGTVGNPNGPQIPAPLANNSPAVHTAPVSQ